MIKNSSPDRHQLFLVSTALATPIPKSAVPERMKAAQRAVYWVRTRVGRSGIAAPRANQIPITRAEVNGVRGSTFPSPSTFS